jgi:16S rRNA (uracil1498-N3)-methyltransferase
MPRRRFFISPDRIRDGTVSLAEDQAHHLRTVLRLRVGEAVDLFDGYGNRYSGIVDLRDSGVYVGSLVKQDCPETAPVSLVLAAALIKSDRFEWVLQKGTELGVSRFIPLETHFANVRIPAERLESRLARWRRIICEAAKQSRTLTLPEISAPCTFQDLTASAEYGGAPRLMLHEKGGERLQFISNPGPLVLLCVGPEGGWHESETRAALSAGFRLIHMGSRILRAETAAITSTALVQFLLEN